MTPKYPNIIVDLSHVDGNAFSLMGVVTRTLRNHGVSSTEIDQYRKESMSGDYDNLLQTIGKWVTVDFCDCGDEDDYEDDYDSDYEDDDSYDDDDED
jgi:hypothetical protein